MFAGSKPAVTAKYVIDTGIIVSRVRSFHIAIVPAQLNCVPTKPKDASREFLVPDPKIFTLPLFVISDTDQCSG
jgi:hypothetical protein